MSNYSQLIYSLLKVCKQNALDFDLEFSYYDENDHIIKQNFIDCNYHWDITIYNEHDLYPQQISIYDKGYDGEVKIDFEDIVAIYPHKPTNYEEQNKNLCNVMDNLYNIFCTFWDNKDYVKAKIIMECLHKLTISS